MKNTLFAIILFGSFLTCSLPAAGQYSLDDRLFSATRNDKLEEILLLLEKGANINAQDQWGRTPLIMAVECCRIDTVKLLLEKGADTEATERIYSRTALIQAAVDGSIAKMELLLEKGANIEGKDKEGLTALIMAAGQRNVEVVKLLLEKGANVEAKSKGGFTALNRANTYGPAELVDLLEQARRQRKQHEQTRSQVEQLEQTQWKNPQERFDAFVRVLQQNPKDDSLREKVIGLAISLPELPVVPEEARQLFVEASLQMKQASSPQALVQPIGLLRKSLEIAPWWANAYFNLSRALELSGQYDEAVMQLNYYLKLNPPEADAREARARLVVIQTKKDVAGKR